MFTADLPVVDCSGSPRERGRAHGEALRAVIADKILLWHQAIGEAYGVRAAMFLPRFLAETDFRAAIARHTPDLLDEVAGIAEGAGLDNDTAYALQLMDEEWWFGRSLGDGHCSSLAIAPSSDQPTFVAQTMDLPRWHDGAQALLRLTGSDGSQTLVLTSAGMIGLTGLSGRGLGLCVNTLSQLATSRKGLPVAFAMRGALARADAAQAVAFLRSVHHASGQNYQIGDRHGIDTLECSAAGAVTVAFEAGRSLHTNHPLASRDARDAEVSMQGSDNSRARLDSLRQDLAPSRRQSVDADAVRTALSACRPGGEVSIEIEPGSALTASVTFGALVSEIGENITLSVCAGAPSAESWREIALASA